MNWLARCLALLLSGATGCSAAPTGDVRETPQAVRVTGSDSVRIALPEAIGDVALLQIEADGGASDRSVSLAVFADEAPEPFTSVTLFPTGAPGTFSLRIPPGASSLTLRASDTASGEALTGGRFAFTATLRPVE